MLTGTICDHPRVRRRAPLRLRALLPAFMAASVAGGYATKRAALPQSGIHAFAPSRGAPYASSGASPAGRFPAQK